MNKPIVPRQIGKVFEGQVLSASVESITLPRDKCLKAAIIRHPASVVLILVADRREIVLVRQYRHVIGRFGVKTAGRKSQDRRSSVSGRPARVSRGN